MIGALFDYTESWNVPHQGVIALLSVLGSTLFPKATKYIFFGFLSLLFIEDLNIYPELSNHGNVLFFLAILLLPVQAFYVFKPKDVNFKSLITAVKLTSLCLYFFTFFHKLNTDFLNFEFSCANFVLFPYIQLLPEFIGDKFVLINPYIALIIEGLVPLLLFLKNTRVVALVLASLLHFTLAPAGFTDFSSFAFALIWCFVAVENLNTEKLLKHFRILSAAVIFLVLGLSIDKISAPQRIYIGFEGILFILIYLPFIITHFLPNMSKERINLIRSPLYNFFLLFFIFHGASNYLGLRTTGNFSMFSNLTTEGERSNHLLLESNPFKIFGYQEDTIEILDVSPYVVNIHRSMPEVGQKIPRVEFSRLLEEIGRKAPINTYIKYRYKDKIFESERAGFDESIQLKASWWEKKLLYFRHIQPHDVQRCYW